MRVQTKKAVSQGAVVLATRVTYPSSQRGHMTPDLLLIWFCAVLLSPTPLTEPPMQIGFGKLTRERMQGHHYRWAFLIQDMLESALSKFKSKEINSERQY